MFIEHRTYTVKPGRVAEYMAEYVHGWALHRAHAPCVGHYTTEAGDLFRIVSMWRYESFDDRLERRATLNADPAWREVMGRISPLVTDIRSNLLVPTAVWQGAGSDWYRMLYADIDAMRMDGFLAGLADDVDVVFANHPPLRGKAAVKDAIGGFWSGIAGMKHRFVNVVCEGDQTVLEAQIDYTRKDGKVVTVPCTTVLRRAGGKVAAMRIYLDLAPVFAP